MKKIYVLLIICFVLITSIVIYNRVIINSSIDSHNKSQLNDAIKYSDKIVGEIFISKEEKLHIALSYIKEGNVQEGLDILLALENELDSSNVLYNTVIKNVALSYYELKNYNKSIEYFGKYDITDNIILEKYLAMKYLSSLLLNDDFEKCIKIGEIYLDKFSDDEMKIIVLDNMFSAYIGLKDYDHALEVNKKLKIIDKDNVHHYIGTAYLFRYMYGHEKYKEYLNSLLEKFPNDSELNRLLHKD
jgi:tetratricopeptide (TPR) repeat protein